MLSTFFWLIQMYMTNLSNYLQYYSISASIHVLAIFIQALITKEILSAYDMNHSVIISKRIACNPKPNILYEETRSKQYKLNCNNEDSNVYA